MSARYHHLLAILVVSATIPARTQAQQCDTVVSRTSLAELSGRQIRTLTVTTLDPEPFPGPARVLGTLHVRTRTSTIRRQLLIAAHDTIDTLRVAESLRRLRRLRYIADASIRAVSCGGGPSDLTVATRDDWSTKPSVQVRSASSSVEVTERNLFGSGREATLGVHTALGRTGVGVALRDPWFLGTPLAVEFGRYAYRDGSELFASVGRRDRSVLDPWGFEAQFDRSVHAPVTATSSALGTTTAADAFRRSSVTALVSRRVAVTGTAVYDAQVGAEYRKAELAAGMDAPLVGPAQVRRELAAIDFGLRRRSLSFDTVTWVLPGNALVDVPLSFEGDVLIGSGYDRVTGAPVTHVDLWMGKMFRPSAASLVGADLWTSGYRSPSRWSGGTLRGAVTYFHQAPRGVWSARLAAERLFDPDPDVRALASTDLAAPAFAQSARFAEGAVSLSAERTVELMRLSHSWSVAGAGFGGWTTRWDAAAVRLMAGDGRLVSPPDEEGAAELLSAGIVGFGLRLSPRKPGRAMARLDFGYPLVRMGNVPRRPFIAIGVSPWIDQGRWRDGRDGR